MIGQAIGQGMDRARQAVARALLTLHITPNVLTLIGMALTGAAGVFFALGTAGEPLLLLAAVGLVIGAGACDILDGAVARAGGLATPFGAFLDSTMDRFSDFAVFAGISIGFAARGNLTFALLAQVGFFNAFMISYTRARAEDLIDACRVGFWQRGERLVAVLIASLAMNMPALVVQQALLPLMTALRRIFWTKAVLEGRRPVADPRQGSTWQKLRIWSWPRMTPGYDVSCAVMIAWLIFARFEPVDLLRRWPW